MNEFIYQTLTVTGGLSGVAALIVTWCVLKVIGQEKAQRAAEAQERNALKTKMENLEKQKVDRIEKKLDDHLREDNPQAVKDSFSKIDKALDRIGDKLDRLSENVAEVRTEVKNNKEFTQNLYGSMQKLRDSRRGGEKDDE